MTNEKNESMCNSCHPQKALVSDSQQILVIGVANSTWITSSVSIEDKFSGLHSGLFSLDICRLYWQLSSQLPATHIPDSCAPYASHTENTQTNTQTQRHIQMQTSGTRPPAVAHTYIMVWNETQSSKKKSKTSSDTQGNKDHSHDDQWQMRIVVGITKMVSL